MEIRKLAEFVRVYECGSLTEAARRGFLSRQALSKTIAQLEGELGVLFERRARGVRPTDLAVALYPHARRIVEAYDALEGEARRYASGRAGSMTVALESNAAMTLPAGLLSAYAQARPDVRLVTHTLPADIALEALAEGRVDAVVAGPPPEGAGLMFDPVFSSTLSVVFVREAFDGLADARLEPGQVESGRAVELGPRALEGKQIFGVSPANHVERRLVPYLAEQGIAARVVYDCTDTALATEEMEAGAGGVIVEDGGARKRFGDARYVHVRLRGEGAPNWEVGVVWRDGDACAAIARDFAAFARERVG